MPVSKRDKKVSLTKTKKKGLQLKENIVDRIKGTLDEYNNVFVFTVNNMRNAPLKEVRDQWKDSRFIFAKKTLMIRAIKDQSHVMTNLAKLGKCLIGQCGLLFTDKSKEHVLSWFDEYSTMDYAKSGFVATETVTIPAGHLPDLQSTMEPVLRKLGLPTQLEKGKIILREDYNICTDGARLTPEQATILKHLAKPMSEFKITILCMWSKDGTFEKYKKLQTPSRLMRLIDSKPANLNKSKHSDKKKHKKDKPRNEVRIDETADGDDHGFVLRYDDENNDKRNYHNDDDEEEGIVEDHSEAGEDKSDDNQSDDGFDQLGYERMDEDEEMDEDEGMHEDEEMQGGGDDGILLPLNSEDVGNEFDTESQEKNHSPKEKSPKKTMKTNTPKQNLIFDDLSSTEKSLDDITLNQSHTPKTFITSPTNQKSFNVLTTKTTSPKLTESQPENIIEPSRENESSTENLNKNARSKNTRSAKTSKNDNTFPNPNYSNEGSSKETVTSQEIKSSNEDSKLKSPKIKTPPKTKTPTLNENASSDGSAIVESASSQGTIVLSQDSTEISQETKTSSQEESETDLLDYQSGKPDKTPNTRKRKDSTSKQSNKSAHKEHLVEQAKTEASPDSKPSPKITKTNPRRSQRIPKPIKRTPPNENKHSEVMTGSAKRSRSTPLKGTPQKSKDTPKRTARRKSIFPETVSEDVEMK